MLFYCQCCCKPLAAITHNKEMGDTHEAWQWDKSQNRKVRSETKWEKQKQDTLLRKIANTISIGKTFCSFCEIKTNLTFLNFTVWCTQLLYFAAFVLLFLTSMSLPLPQMACKSSVKRRGYIQPISNIKIEQTVEHTSDIQLPKVLQSQEDGWEVPNIQGLTTVYHKLWT